jgi:aryl-alcohol dehydrogenase-like predicted oxidoreductase
MEYALLGRTGVRVSRLCFGASFGMEVDQSAVAALFHRCRDVGINYFDTADVYYDGAAEEALGRLIPHCRNEIVLESKCGFPFGEGINDRGLSRRHILSAVEASLKRLRTDHLDLYYFHTFDPGTSIEESLRAMDDLVHQGKIRYPAVSNWAAWQIAKALGIAARQRLAPFESVQPMYSLVKRQAEVEILPMAQEEQMGVVVYSPMAAGLLSGKYSKTSKPKDGLLMWDPVQTVRYGDTAYLKVAERFAAHARKRGVHPAALARAWVLAHPAVTAVIVGARDLEQLEIALGTLDVPMTPEWRAEISALSPEPPPATDRSEVRKGVYYLGWGEPEK